MKVLAIETSCDDTSLAIVSSVGEDIFCEYMVAFHQIDLHDGYGGVVPELASREHLNQIIPVLYDLCYRVTGGYNMDDMMQDIDHIVVTHTPGLPGSLIIGRSTALLLSHWYEKPCQYVNHLHGHIFSFLLDRQDIDIKKTLILSVSGGHSDMSILNKIDNIDVYIDNRIGQFEIQKNATTRDDAIGEVFDKISRLLGGPYPGGVWISQQALLYDYNILQKKYPFVNQKFKRIILSDTYDFSFSGMKSQAYNFISLYRKELGLGDDELLPQEIVSYLAYEFQEAAADILSLRILQLVQQEGIVEVALVGGVSANTRIREKIQDSLNHYGHDSGQNVSFFTPVKFDYCTDNAAMIGAVGIVMNR